jgi:hypothetical protein
LDSVEEAKTEMLKQIEATENKEPEELQSPISVSLDLKALRESQKPGDRSIADILQQLSEIRRLMDQTEKERYNRETAVIIVGLINDLFNFLMAMEGHISLLQISFSQPEYPSKEQVVKRLNSIENNIGSLSYFLGKILESVTKGDIKDFSDIDKWLKKR